MGTLFKRTHGKLGFYLQFFFILFYRSRSNRHQELTYNLSGWTYIHNNNYRNLLRAQDGVRLKRLRVPCHQGPLKLESVSTLGDFNLGSHKKSPTVIWRKQTQRFSRPNFTFKEEQQDLDDLVSDPHPGLVRNSPSLLRKHETSNSQGSETLLVTNIIWT